MTAIPPDPLGSMLEYQLLLFADQTVDSGAYLTEVSLQHAYSKILLPLFQSATRSLQTEIQRLPHYERKAFGKFDSILDLTGESSRRGPSILISTVLHCVAQIASLIVVTENQPDFLRSDSQRYFVGVCTGLFAAAVAATCEKQQEIIDITPEITAVAFYLGLETARRSDSIEADTRSWARATRRLETEDTRVTLRKFHEEKGIPPHKSAYVSAESLHQNTISGPPSTLELLFKNSKYISTPSVPTSVTAAFHADHLSLTDIERNILKPARLRNKPLRNHNHVISPSTGNSYKGGTLHSLLHEGIVDILQTPIKWDSLLDGLAASLGDRGVKMTAIGAPGGINLICQGLTSRGITWIEASQPTNNPSSQSEAIAVVGMSGRFPGGQDLQEFWDTLATGKDMHKQVPTDRFDIKRFLDPTGVEHNTSRTPFGCFIDQLGHFDANLFNVSPREAKQMDPTQRLLLMSAYEALEMAGYSDGRGGKVGTFTGQMSDDWRECNASGDIDLYYIPGTMRVFGPGRLQYYFGWDGPSYSVDTACSASLSSVDLACRALFAGDCDTALAGGGNVMTGPQMTTGLSKGGFLSPSGPCRTFDDTADGYCRGEGVGVIVLKRLSDAIADNDEIQGVIRGIGTNHSADAPSITQPHQPTQERLFKKVLRDACVPPSSVDYVELHGTGTQRGDVTEVSSVVNVCGHGRTSDFPLTIGSVKANVGHGEAAAGITSLIKSLLMFQKNTIPPHIGVKTQLNHQFPPFNNDGICIPVSSRPFDPKSNGARRILVNNFNAAGGNTSLLLEDYPRQAAGTKDPRTNHVVTLSAKTRHSLQEKKQRLRSYLEKETAVEIGNLSYSTTARRLHHGLRTAYSTTSVSDLIHQMDRDLSNSHMRRQSAESPPIIFSFAGQGFRYIGIASQLFQTCSIFRDSLHELSNLCEMLGFGPCLEVLLDDKVELEGVAPVTAQLALVCLELAMARLWQTWGVEPDAVIGHSLGEYSALCVAGVLSTSDTLSLVGKRAVAMEGVCSRGSHAMLAVHASGQTTEKFLMGDHFSSCVISCLNSGSSTIISGPANQIEELSKLLSTENVRNTVITVPYAFHSPQMDDILDPIKEFSKGIPFSKPAIPVISSLYGKIVRDQGVFDNTYLAKQTREKVNFVGALDDYQCSDLYSPDTIWVDCGPGPGCISFVQATMGPLQYRGIVSLRSGTDCWRTLTQGLASLYNSGVDIQWADYHKEHEPSLRLLQLPTYAFDLKNYWLPFNVPQNLDMKAIPEDSVSLTCLQGVESDITKEDGRHIVFFSDPKTNDLVHAIQGQQLLDGMPQCPISVWCDMAFGAAVHINGKSGKNQTIPPVEISHMKNMNALEVGLECCDNIGIRTSCHLLEGADSMDISIESEQGDGKSRHADCEVQIACMQKWKTEWDRVSFLLNLRMEYLRNPANADTIWRIPGSMLYERFSSQLNYNNDYRSIRELFLNPNSSEGCGRIKFSAETKGNFTHNPYWVDGLLHIAGFILNANSFMGNSEKGCHYVLDGWESLRISKELSSARDYSIYVRMTDSTQNSTCSGDVYLFEGDKIVASCFGISFRGISQTPSTIPSTPRRPRTSTVDYYDSSSSDMRTPDSSEKYNSPDEDLPERTTPVKRSSEEQSPAKTDKKLEERVLDILSEEVSTDVTELEENTAFSDLGIDSLLSISIINSIGRDTGLRLPASVFVSYPTISSFHEHLRGDILVGGTESA